MSQGELSAFAWAAARRVRAVDIDPRVTNQHELGGVAGLRARLVDEGIVDSEAARTRLAARWLILQPDDDALVVDDELTLYDARQANPARSAEWRLYYASGSATEDVLRSSVAVGDLVVYAVPVSRAPAVLCIVASAGSQWERVLLRLFPLEQAVEQQLVLIPQEPMREAQDTAAARAIVELLGIAVYEQSDIDWLRARLGDDLAVVAFPTTREMAALAAERAGAGQATTDQRLIELLDAETRLFYALESVQALPRFREAETLDEYLDLAQSLFQRRKSRRGYSLENHLETIFVEEAIAHETQVPLGDDRLDFLFPGLAAYEDRTVDRNVGVSALNAKSTIRERWRQVLTEAPLLDQRFIATLDPNLTTATIEAAAEAGVTMVMPDSIAEHYADEARARLWTLERFLEHLRQQQVETRN